MTPTELEHSARHVLRQFEHLSPQGTRLLVQAAAIHGAHTRVSAHVDVGRRQIFRLAASAPAAGDVIADPLLSACVTVAGDHRFAELLPLGLSPGFQGFCARRGLR